ncbi:MAG: class I SAM-dependent methyltransferase [Dehalococcoidia bacterium]
MKRKGNRLVEVAATGHSVNNIISPHCARGRLLMKRILLRLKNPKQMFKNITLRNLKTYFFYLKTVHPTTMENMLTAKDVENLVNPNKVAHLKVGFFPPGHFHSTIPDVDRIRRKEKLLWSNFPQSLPGIDLNTAEQLRYLNEFKNYYKDMPFKRTKSANLRYFFENDYYSYSDAIGLYSMIRKLKPERIIEVGSGYSSCVMLDTNEIFFQNKIAITFIEPYPERLMSLVKKDDLSKNQIVRSELQDADKNLFDSLQENDILFIDSTHVAKIGSDVNYIFFDVLPVLKKGVHIHFHDVFYPFEYPKSWIYRGWFWNEDYILKAFLQYNTDFKIVFFNTYLEHFYREIFKRDMPLCLKDTTIGTPEHGSIWLKKVH